MQRPAAQRPAASREPKVFTDEYRRLARFEREAKILASLNDPNIGQIYGLRQSG